MNRDSCCACATIHVLFVASKTSPCCIATPGDARFVGHRQRRPHVTHVARCLMIRCPDDRNTARRWSIAQSLTFSCNRWRGPSVLYVVGCRPRCLQAKRMVGPPSGSACEVPKGTSTQPAEGGGRCACFMPLAQSSSHGVRTAALQPLSLVLLRPAKQQHSRINEHRNSSQGLLERTGINGRFAAWFTMREGCA